MISVILPPLGLPSLACTSLAGLLVLLHPRMVTARLGGRPATPQPPRAHPKPGRTCASPRRGLRSPFYTVLGLAVIPTVTGIGLLLTRLESTARKPMEKEYLGGQLK